MHEKKYELSANINDEPLISLKNDDMEFNDLIKEPKKVEEEKKLLIYEAKSVSMFKIICHLSGKLEIFFMLFGTICTFFSGCSNSLWCVIAGSTINELTTIAGMKDLADDQYNEKIKGIKDPVNKLIILFVTLGALTLISNFFMLFLWGYSALKQMDTLKIKYFELILNQEQSWFDEHNSFEFATKVQSQLDQVELGLGDRFSQIILMIAEIISGFSVGFMTSWKLTLIICSSFPIIVVSVLVSNYFTEKLILKSKELNEKSGGISEEILYNIKTVTSFCNFDFEMNRYNQIITELNKCEQKRALVDSLAFGILYSATLLGISASIIAVRSMIINKETNHSTGKPYHGGDIFTVVMGLITAIYSISGLGPNFNIIKKSCLAASDYFTLLSRYKKKPNITSGYRPSREKFQGKIEFNNVSFSYPYDKTRKLVLDNLNIVIEPGKKIAIIGESGCGKVQL